MASQTAEDPSTGHRLVMIAVDGSESSKHAFNTYIDTLRRPDDTVVLFTVKELKNVLNTFWKDAVYTYDHELLKSRLGKEEEETKALLKPLAQRLHDLGMKHKQQMAVGQDAGHVIVKTARDEHVHLIVMGSRGRSDIRRTLMGSCSSYVLHHSYVPVVVCRKQ